LRVGEVIELLEQAGVEGSTTLSRVRCRAILDGKEGYATLKGNQGTSFLEKCTKPFYCCDREVQLHEAFQSRSPVVRTLQEGEVLEVLQGPQREEEAQSCLRLHGVAVSDGADGWVTQRDASGKVLLEPKTVFVCRAAVSVTPIGDIASGKALRKLDVGELVEMVHDGSEDATRNLTRAKIRARRDGTEGFVTMTGNQGMAYIEESQRHYECRASTTLESKLASGSNSLRTLEVGELFEAIEGPKAETKEGASRLKGRSLRDGSEGWLTLSRRIVYWFPHYKCEVSTPLTDALEVASAKTLRTLDVGERLDVLDAPAKDEASGSMRVRVRADKDGISGFATISGANGAPCLVSLQV